MRPRDSPHRISQTSYTAKRESPWNLLNQSHGQETVLMESLKSHKVSQTSHMAKKQSPWSLSNQSLRPVLWARCPAPLLLLLTRRPDPAEWTLNQPLPVSENSSPIPSRTINIFNINAGPREMFSVTSKPTYTLNNIHTKTNARQTDRHAQEAIFSAVNDKGAL